MASRTLRLQLVAAFATLALIVSVVGLASALARSVTERQRESGSGSLGATPAAPPVSSWARARGSSSSGWRSAGCAIAAGRALDPALGVKA
jgi:hypothetical protein